MKLSHQFLSERKFSKAFENLRSPKTDEKKKLFSHFDLMRKSKA